MPPAIILTKKNLIIGPTTASAMMDILVWIAALVHCVQIMKSTVRTEACASKCQFQSTIKLNLLWLNSMVSGIWKFWIEIHVGNRMMSLVH